MKLFFRFNLLFIFINFFSVSFVFSSEKDFDTALDEIISRSTLIASEASNLEALKYKNLPSRLVFLPTLILNAKEPLTGTSNFLTATREISIDSNLNLFKGGADFSGLFSANLAQESQQHKVSTAFLKVESKAVKTLITQIQRKKETQIHLKIVRNREELLDIARQRYRRGYLPFQDVEKLMIDLSNAQANLSESEMNFVEAQKNLESLFGENSVRPEWPWVHILKKDMNNLSQSELTDLNQRPDWKEFQTKIDSENYKLSQYWRTLAPSVDLKFSFGHYRGYFGSVEAWIGQLTLTLPLFDHLSNYSRAKEQSYFIASKELEFEQLKRNSKSKWEMSKINFSKALQSAVQRDQTLKLTKKLYQDNKKRFQSGRIDVNDLAIDQNRMNEADFLAIQAWTKAHLEYMGLCHSLGRRIKNCI